MRRSILAGLSILTLLAAPRLAQAVEAPETDPPSSADPARTITLIHLNDLHANLVSHLDMVRVAPEDGRPAEARVEMRGGVARIATLVRQIRDDSPHSLLLNVGDTYHGGVEALYTRGNAIVPAVNALGIDVGVPGNWDFAYGAVTTRLRYQADPAWLARALDWLLFDGDVERPNFPNLAANLEQTMPPTSAGERLLPGTLVLEVGGVRVGFIGLTSDIVPRMASPFAWGFDFLQGEGAYRELLDDEARKLRTGGADIVVVLSELGLHRDRRLADVVGPGIDVFFSAHTHEVTPEPLESRSGALVVEAGNDGYLGRMDLTVEGGKLVDRRWHLLDVDESVAEDPEVAALVAQARAPFLAETVAMDYPAPWVEMPLERPIDTVVGRVDSLLHRRNVLHNPFNDLLADVIRREADTQISMTPGFRFDAVVLPSVSTSGDPGKRAGRRGAGITIEQIYRYLPISPTLAVGEIRGADLREILEVELVRVFSPDAFEHSGGWLGSFGGLDLEVDLSRPDGDRIRQMRLTGEAAPIDDDDVLTVASCVRPFDEEGVMCSNPNFRHIQELKNPVTGRAWTPLELLIDAFASGRVHAAASERTARITDHSGQPHWPEAPHIQPLHEGHDLDGRVARFDAP
jgi:2',3'-cyclic-nucleotide 2'-phosphodiesterase (5'-nucleotidase family)